MPARKYSDDTIRIAELRRHAAAGKTQKETAAATGLTHKNVSRLAIKHEIEFTSARGSKHLWPAMRECAERGLTKAETARELNVPERRVGYFAAQHPEVVFRYGRSNGVEVDVAGQPAPEGMTTDQARDFHLLLQRGRYSVGEAKAAVMRRKRKVSVSPAAIGRYLAKAQGHRRGVA